MKRATLILIALAPAVLCAVGIAQGQGQPAGNATPAAPTASPTRAGVIDLIRIFNECQQILDLNDQIKKKTDDYGKEAAERRKRIEDKQTALNAFKPGTPDYEARRTELVRANIDANVWLKVAEQEIEQDRYTWTIKVYEKACEMAAVVAKERGMDLVLQRTAFRPDEIQEQSVQAIRRIIQDRVVVYNSDDLDITEAVIAKMNADYRNDPARPKIGSASGPTFGGGSGSSDGNEPPKR
ncbi:Outer membrane protein (OmpH-like) [Phycisphaerae bacterium RAS2]|nr:Outer membrane protein (OmpH-like) [Phycisphaerae bacterium RAS2]